MTLYEKWIQSAYDSQGNVIKKIWDVYLPLEQKIYENMLGDKNPAISGTVAELGEKYNMPPEFVMGFLDGISGALDVSYEMNDLAEDSQINAVVNFETLYKRMVEYDAKHLADLPQWDNVLTAQRRAELYKEQKSSATVVREGAKTGRNDPCPCASGKKYKKCCGIGAA